MLCFKSFTSLHQFGSYPKFLYQRIVRIIQIKSDESESSVFCCHGIKRETKSLVTHIADLFLRPHPRTLHENPACLRRHSHLLVRHVLVAVEKQLVGPVDAQNRHPVDLFCLSPELVTEALTESFMRTYNVIFGQEKEKFSLSRHGSLQVDERNGL